jgi:hypothetical protein
MKWTQDARNEIVAALIERVPDQRLRPCAVCGTTQWILLDGFVSVEGSSDFYGWPIGEPGGDTLASRDLVYPFALLSCTHCGNSHFLNLRLLGLDHLIVPQENRSPVLLPPQINK